MKRVLKSIVGLASVFLVSAASAGLITVTASDAGITTSSVAGVTTVDFNAGNCAGYAACSGDFAIVNGSLSGRYAQPFGTNTNYISVPNPSVTTHSALLSLGANADYFGLFWGSIDSYNSISFFSGSSLLGTYSGSQLPNLTANGNQTAWSSNRYINFTFGGATFDTVQLNSSNFAFESDNHAFRKVSVPEPMDWALMGLGLFGLFVVRRFNRA